MVASKLALILLSASAALVAADEPQLDIAAVAEAGAPPQPSIATNVAAQTITYNANQASAEAAASQSAAADDDAGGDSPARVKRAPCDPQQTGAGPVPSPDTASAFAAYLPFSASASAVPVPTGYDLSFQNLNGENNALGYMGFTLMNSYDSTACAAKCNAIYGCNAFNIAFERSPSKDPSPSGGACDQPPTTTLIKCVFWGGPVTSANAVNRGQWRNNYQVVVAGSNGYINSSVDTITGYDTPHYLQNDAISAPTDCNGASTYIGNQYWNDGKPFDTRRCAAACTAQTSSSPTNPCRFFNTYIINKGNQPYGQYCAMYTTSYNDTYATLSSVTYNSSTYSVSFSYSYAISSYSFTCTKTQTSLSCTNPGACGTYKPCTGNSNTDCICGTDVSGNKVCFRGSTPCSSQSCTANSQCPTGSICLSSNSCCGASVCAVWNTCTNTQSKRWIFRSRDVATVGGGFAKRQDNGTDTGDDDVWTAAHIPDSMQTDDDSGDDSGDDGSS